ncbi:MAG: hypothetical protein ACRDIB_12625 [Ardenticatenaceae bacterium]
MKGGSDIRSTLNPLLSTLHPAVGGGIARRARARYNGGGGRWSAAPPTTHHGNRTDASGI